MTDQSTDQTIGPSDRPNPLGPTATFPFPTLPPPPADPGEYLTYFRGHLNYRIDRKTGRLILEIAVADEDKYAAMPLTDVRGRSFNFTVTIDRARGELVKKGKLAVYEARDRARARRWDRQWKKLREQIFDGVEEVDGVEGERRR